MKARLAAVRDLGAGERRAMLALLGRHFAGVTPERFAADLEAKNWALLLEGEGGALAGFSTLHYGQAVVAGQPVSVVTSGDTIVDPSGWNGSVLAPAWITAVRSLHRAQPGRRLLWLLLTSGFRTYRFLPVFWRDFYPRHDRPTPPEAAAMIEALARQRYGRCYDRAAGIVRFDEPQVLRNGLGAIPPSRLDDPDVAFFARANPGHAAGDELVCLTELCEGNLTPAGRRAVRRGERAGWALEAAAAEPAAAEPAGVGR